MATRARRPHAHLRSHALIYLVIAAFLILAHGPLLRLPFFWDEIGQFIPASLDLLHSGALIPVSTIPNVHPPGLPAYLALFWSIFGYSIGATRIAMLLLAAFGGVVAFLLAIELTRGFPGTPAFSALVLLCASPLFFSQSMLAQLDMPAMCLSLLALLLFLQNRLRAAAITCTLLVMVKETGLIVPAVLGVWILFERRERRERMRALWFLLPVPGLLIWLVALQRATGHWLGNAQFASYNLFEPLHPVSFLLALIRRIYYLFLSTGHFIGTAALIYAWRRLPGFRTRAWGVAASVTLAQVLVVSALGGAVLERYLLPVLPIVYIAFAASLEALTPRTRAAALAGLLVCFVAANFINPPYPFPLENNLAFASFVRLEQQAAHAADERTGRSPGLIATVFPIANALRDPVFGFVRRPMRVDVVLDFSRPEMDRLKGHAPDRLIVWQREWDPLHLLERPAVRGLLTRYYGYRPDLTPEEIADLLSMRIVRRWENRGLSMQLLERATGQRPARSSAC